MSYNLCNRSIDSVVRTKFDIYVFIMRQQD